MANTIIDSLDEWERVELKEMEAKVGRKATIDELIDDYCMDSIEMVRKLYIPDIGMLAKVVSIKDCSENDSSVILTRSLVPKANPTLNPSDYNCRDMDYYHSTSDDDGHIDFIIDSESFLSTRIKHSVKQQIVRDYYELNKYTHLDVDRNYDIHILYFNFDDLDSQCSYIDKPTSYLDLVEKVQNKVLISEEENGVYYAIQDTSSNKLIIYFAKFVYANVFGDDYFKTMYYTVDEQLNKTFTPTDRVLLIVDTMEMAILFNHLIDLTESLPQEDINSFDTETSKYTVHYKSTGAAYYEYIGCHHPTDNDSILESVNYSLVPVYFDTYSTDFILAFECNAKWEYIDSIRQAILSQVNLTDVFHLLTNTEKFHYRCRTEACTQFNNTIYFVDSDDGNAVKKAVDSLANNKCKIVNYTEDNSVSIWYKSSYNAYCNIDFQFIGNVLTNVSLYINRDFKYPNKDYSSTLNSLLTPYIAKSMVNYIKNLYYKNGNTN